MRSTPSSASLTYHEPEIAAILVLSSLILLLNVVNSLLDKLLYCGLIGQIFIGVAWGTPGAQWLEQSFESALVQLGYLGLLLLVYEGTSIPVLAFRIQSFNTSQEDCPLR
jgi:hypothetical protein